jgi:hypothetical protein
MSWLLVFWLAAGDCMPVDRGLLAEAVRQYTKAPGPAATAAAKRAIPGERVCEGEYGNATAAEALYGAVQALRPILATRLKAGRQDAWELGIAVRSVTDGGLLEDLDGTLADAISAQPRAYLRAVKDAPRPGGLHAVWFLGERFTDSAQHVRCDALRARLSAISSVRDEELAATRSAALQILRPNVERCEQSRRDAPRELLP